MRFVTLILLLTFAFGCEKPDDITAIRAVVDDLADRARAHDVSAMMDHVTSEYVADPGARDQAAVRPLLMLALRRYGKFSIEYPTPGIQLDAESGTATASVPFLVVREGQKFPAAELAEIADDPVAWAEQVADLVGDPYQLDLHLKRTGDGWKIRKSDIGGFKRIDEL